MDSMTLLQVRILAMLLIGQAFTVANADFTLNFEPVPIQERSSRIFDCTQAAQGIVQGGCLRGGSFLDPDTTYFFQEMAIKDGARYYHTIIGDPTVDDFAIEYFTLVGGGCCWAAYGQFPRNASAGTYNGGADATPGWPWGTPFQDPLDSNPNLSGNATGHPEKNIFRQILRGEGFEQEVKKAFFSNKPLITQNITQGTFSSNFAFDMSTIGYNDISTTGLLTNTMAITDPTFLLSWDQATDAQKANVIGGKFTYTPGTGDAGSFGSYSYEQSNFDVYAIEWMNYWDASVNIPNE